MQGYYQKCFNIAVVAKSTQTTLNKIIVGRVFTVDDHIKARLDNKAKI